MKKLVIGASAAFLSLGLSFGGLTPTHAAGNESNVETSSYTKSVSQTKYYSGNITPPSSIPYSQSGWTGTLYLQTKAFDGTYTIASYSGNVSCTSNCAMSSSEVE